MTTLTYNKKELEQRICAALGLDPATVKSLSINFEAGEPLIDINVTLVADPGLEEVNWEQVIPAAEVSVFIESEKPAEIQGWQPRPSEIKDEDWHPGFKDGL